MRPAHATLISALNSGAYATRVKLVVGASTYAQERIMAYSVREWGYGQAECTITLNNADSAIALSNVDPFTQVDTYEGALVAGTEYWIFRHKWLIVRTSPPAVQGTRTTLTLVLRNYFEKFNRITVDPLSYTDEAIGDTIDHIANEAGVTVTRAAGAMWAWTLDYEVPVNSKFQTALLGIVGQHVHASGKFNSSGEWALKPIAAAPSVDLSLYITQGPRLYGHTIQRQPAPSHINLGNAEGQDAAILSDVSADQGTLRAFKRVAVRSANRAARLTQEIIEARENWKSGDIEIQPRPDVEIGDVLDTTGMVGYSDGQKWRVMGSRLEYGPGKWRMWVTVRTAASVDTADVGGVIGEPPTSPPTVGPPPWEVPGGGGVIGPGPTVPPMPPPRPEDLTPRGIMPDPAADTLNDTLDDYGGDEIAATVSAQLHWLQLLNFEPNTGITIGANKVFLANDLTLDAPEGAYMARQTAGSNVAVGKQKPSGVWDFTADSRFTASDFICVAFYATSASISFASITFEDSAGNSAQASATLAVGWNYFSALRSTFTLTNVSGTFSWALITKVYVGIERAGADDVRAVAADKDDATTFNDTGRTWDFYGGGVWHIYTDLASRGIPYALGQIKTTSAGTRYVALRNGHFLKDHFVIGALARTNGALGLIGYAASYQDCYELKHDPSTSTLTLIRWIAGASSTLASGTFAASTNQIIYLALRRVHAEILCYASTTATAVFDAVNLRLRATDPTYNNGRLGAVSYGYNARFFNARAGSPEHAISAEIAYHLAPSGIASALAVLDHILTTTNGDVLTNTNGDVLYTD